MAPTFASASAGSSFYEPKNCWKLLGWVWAVAGPGARSMMETKGKMSHWHQPKSQGWVTRWNKEEDPKIGRQLSGQGIGPKSVRRSLDWKSEEGIHANDVYKAGRCWQGAARCREDRAPIVGHLRHSQQRGGNPWDQQDLRKRMQHLFADLQWVHPT